MVGGYSLMLATILTKYRFLLLINNAKRKLNPKANCFTLTARHIRVYIIIYKL